MPYKTFIKTVGGKQMYCAKSLKTGKSFCSKSSNERQKAMETRGKFSHISPQIVRKLAAKKLRLG